GIDRGPALRPRAPPLQTTRVAPARLSARQELVSGGDVGCHEGAVLVMERAVVARPAARGAFSLPGLPQLALSAGAFVGTLLLAELALWVLGVDPRHHCTAMTPHPLWHHWHRADYRFDFDVAAEGYME